MSDQMGKEASGKTTDWRVPVDGSPQVSKITAQGAGMIECETPRTVVHKLPRIRIVWRSFKGLLSVTDMGP
jgi:hypothetical protein